jgi:FMN phosphatase YigB (HAD superfamily)
MFDASFRKAAARILHLDDHVRVGVSGADFDRAPAPRMFERVLHQIRHSGDQ